MLPFLRGAAFKAFASLLVIGLLVGLIGCSGRSSAQSPGLTSTPAATANPSPTATVESAPSAVAASATATPTRKPELYVSTGAVLGRLYTWPRFPTAIQIDNHDFLTELAWTIGPNVATARGTHAGDNCIPDCASGTPTSSPVALQASQPESCTVRVSDPTTGAWHLQQAYVYNVVAQRSASNGKFVPFTVACPHHWPTLVQQAMAVVYGPAGAPVLPARAPSRWPAGYGVPSSATVTVSSLDRSYTVELYRCPKPLPLNDPGIGSGECGVMAALYGSFGGQAYESMAAASNAVPAAPGPPAGCTTTRQVRLQPDIEATLYSSTAANCEVVWQEGEWTFALGGDLNGGTSGDATEPWTAIASSIVTYLDSHRLPEAHGSFVCDIAADGLHTSLAWVIGIDVYSVAVYHGAIPALSLAIAMASYP